MKKFTHTGTVEGLGYMNGHNRIYNFRETKKYWISHYQEKYNKTTGYPIGEQYPVCRLKISSLKEIVESKG